MRWKMKPRRVLERVFPILQWSRHYELGTALGDLIAGVTVALTLIPQSIAYASLAGFQPQYGLYASLVGGFVYGAMGSIPQINIGPTALLSLLTFTYTSGTNPDFAVLLCFVGGIVTLAAGVAQLGFLVDFVSTPVVSGFTSAAAVTIASSQIKGLLGLQFDAETFIATWRAIFQNIGKTRLYDTLLGLSCCVLLTGMKSLKDIRIAEAKEKSKAREMLRRVLWALSVSRNALAVLAAAALAFWLHQDADQPFILTGPITAGLPHPRVPAFQTKVGNSTVNAAGMLGHLGSGLVVLPLVGIISNVAIAKAFSKGKSLDATQEIVALGICNMVGAFFGSFPVNGSFTRSAVSDASGVVTPAAGFYTGAIVLLTLSLLTPYFFFIPRAALSAVITCAVLHMVDLRIVPKLWRTNRLDVVPLACAFVGCLVLGVELGLGCGVALDALLLLWYQAHPPLRLARLPLPPHIELRPVGGLHFASAERVRAKLLALKRAPPRDIRAAEAGVAGLDLKRPPDVLVVHCDALSRFDYTFLQSMKMLVEEWSREGHVVWCGAEPNIRQQLETLLLQPLLCSREQLPTILAGLTSVAPVGSESDTHL